MPGPMSGIGIVDTSAVVTGPLAAMMLADQGAEVIKVEPPQGDILRIGGFSRGGMSSFLANCNRGKRSLALDLKQPAAQKIVQRLVERSDVFIENWRPGAAERLGLGEAELRKLRPDLIYVSIKAFGKSGPYRDRRAYDPVIQAYSGHLSVQKNPEFPVPDLIRNVVSDKSTAYTAAQAITAALFARERGAGGQRVELSMLDASLAFFWPDGMMDHTMLGDGVGPGITLAEAYHVTPTADGHLIYLVASDSEAHGLFRALRRPELCEHPDYATFAARAEHREALGEIIAREFLRFPTRELAERLAAEDVPFAPVLTLPEVIADPQVRHNRIVFESSHPSAGTIRQAGPAAHFSATPEAPGRFPPLLGEHSDEVLSELGFDSAQRDKLRAEGVVFP